MITLSRNLLERSPEETTRRLCLALWGEADEALTRLEAGEDGEALHDFRVALRRLRSVLRAYRPFLRRSRANKLRRAIGALASSTNLARDVEVQLEWLEARGPGPSEALRAHLETQRVELPTGEALRKQFAPIGKTLAASLSRLRLSGEVEADTFLAATGRLLTDRAGVLRAGLDGVASAEEAETLHRTRIEAKRLRYLLEPLQNEVPKAQPLIKKMKGLQDCLGELQDTRVLTETIAGALEGVALEEARRLRDEALGRTVSVSVSRSRSGSGSGSGSVRQDDDGRPTDEDGGDADRDADADEDAARMTSAGLYELLQAQRDRRDDAFAALGRAWLGDESATFFNELAATAERLAARRARCFLLSGVPEPVTGTVGVEVRQGFVPGKNVVEHIRSERRGRRTRLVRAVEVEGRTTEEPLSRALFDALWPLTAGRRLDWRRYEVGACTIEVVADQNVVLARVETPPDWLHPWVVRDVTGVKRYAFESLARARSAPEKPSDREAASR